MRAVFATTARVPHLRSWLRLLCLVGSILPAVLCAAPAVSVPPRHVLQAEEHWFLNLPEGKRFDTSGLLKTATGELLTVNDRDAAIARIAFSVQRPHEADLVLTNLFPPDQLATLQQEKNWPGRLDGEGLAADAEGQMYLCEETHRGIFRVRQPGTTHAAVTLLPIDWSPVTNHFSTNLNASFEGIAIGGGKMFVANERDDCRIFTVDLATGRLTGNFAVHPGLVPDKDTTIADLCWFEGRLFILCRRDRCIVETDPDHGRILAVYDYSALEQAPEHAYLEGEPYGLMEGLAVDARSFWLVNDNNGQGRKSSPADKRPLLLRCPRPDRPAK